MIASPFDDFVSMTGQVGLSKAAGDTTPIAFLLWGDGVRRVDEANIAGRRNVRARGRLGWVDTSALRGSSLLDFYLMDAGQAMAC